MKRFFIYVIMLLPLFSVSLSAQDDTEEETVGAPIFNFDDLDLEKNHLEFKANFIESIRQKSIENYKKSLEYLAKCEKIYPENVAMLFESAKNHYSLKQYNQAHAYCDQALSLEPDNFWLMELSRNIFEREFNYPEAIAIQKKLFEIKKTEAENLLKMYYKTKDKKEAQLLIAEIERKNIYIDNFDFYKKHFSKKATPTNTKKNPEQKTPNKSIVDLKKDFAQNKDYVILLEILEKEAQSKQFESLLADSDLGLSVFPAQAKMYLYKGMAFNGLGKYQDAISILEIGLDFAFENKNLIKAFYNALIVSFTGTNNTSKANHYKQLVQKL